MKYKFKAKVEKGKMTFYDPHYLGKVLSLMEEKEIEIVISKFRNKRSNDQNSLYWFYLNFLARELGDMDADCWHTYFRARLLKRHVTINKKDFTVIRSTTDLNTKEFGQYIDYIQRIAATEMDCVLPDPAQVEYSN